MTVTVLRHRGHNAGVAATMAQLHPSYVVSKFAAVVVVKGHQPDSNRRWFNTVGTGIATTTGDPGRPVDWPMRWDCSHCGAHLTLDRDQARHVGRRRNLEVHAAQSTP